MLNGEPEEGSDPIHLLHTPHAPQGTFSCPCSLSQLYLEDSVDDLNGCDLLVNFTTIIANVAFDRNECDTFGALAVNNVDDITVGPNVNFTSNVAVEAPSSGGAVGVSGTVSVPSWLEMQSDPWLTLAEPTARCCIMPHSKTTSAWTTHTGLGSPAAALTQTRLSLMAERWSSRAFGCL